MTKLGFKAIASTSAGAAWATGRDDGDLSLDKVLGHLLLQVAATNLLVNADFGNGFADDLEGVAANVTLALDTDIAGLAIEAWSGSILYDTDLAAPLNHSAR